MLFSSNTHFDSSNRYGNSSKAFAFSALYSSPSLFRSESALEITASFSEASLSFKAIVSANRFISFCKSRNSASISLLLFVRSRFIVCIIPDISNCSCISSRPNSIITPSESLIFASISAILVSKSVFASSCSATSMSTLDFMASSIRTGISACFFFHSFNALENFALISSVDGAFSNSPSNGTYLASVCASSTSDTSVARRIRISR